MKPRLLLLVPTSTYRADAFVRAARRLPVDLSIASETENSLSHLHPVDLPSFDFDDPIGAASRARRFARGTPVHAVVAVDDRSVLAAAAIAEALGLPHNPIDAVRATVNKYLARERMRAAGVPTPKYALLSLHGYALAREMEDAVGYPAVLKPLGMSASRGVVRVNDATAFAPAFERLARLVRAAPSPNDVLARGHILAESYVEGWEVAVEGIVTRGRLDVLAIFDKPDPLEGPVFPETMYVTPSRLPPDTQQRIVETSAAAVRAIGLVDGPVHVELRSDGGAVIPIEVHARSIGGLCSRVLRFADGRSLEDVILQHALGLTQVPPRETRAAGVWMMQAPRAGRFESLRGASAAAEVPDVEEVVVSARPGQHITPLPDGFLYVGFVFARADTPEQVERALRAAFARLEPIIEDFSEEARV
jgi:biotin carboxylase